MRKILILGSHGLVGSHLVPRLKDYEVLALDRVYDVRKELDLPKVDLVINLAALNSSKESIENPRAYFETNVVGNFNMLEAARNMGAKYMYLTSPKALELNPYGVSKFCAEQWCLGYKKTYNMPMIINRLGNLYGPKGDNFWVNIFMQKARRGEEITVFGDGSASRDMLYVDDLVTLLVDQIKNFDLYAKYEYIIPAGGGEENVLSVKDLIHWLEYDRVAYQDDLGTLQHDRVTDNSLVTSINGWKPTTSLDEGLELTYSSIL